VNTVKRDPLQGKVERGYIQHIQFNLNNLKRQLKTVINNPGSVKQKRFPWKKACRA